jgi:hypothetical protein
MNNEPWNVNIEIQKSKHEEHRQAFAPAAPYRASRPFLPSLAAN